MRTPLKNRRPAILSDVAYTSAGGHEQRFTVRFGFDESGSIKEVFCNSLKSGTDLNGLINDACIAISLLLQHGMGMAQLAEAFGENRAEGQEHGPPSSPLGAIVKAGAGIEAD